MLPGDTPNARDQTQPQFRKGKPCFFGAEDAVAEKCQLAAASERNPIDSCDDGLSGFVDGVVELPEDVIVPEVTQLLILELLDVGARAKSLGNFAEDDGGFDLIGFLILLDGIAEIPPGLAAEGIQILRTVEVNEAYSIRELRFHQGVAQLLQERV